MQTLEDRTSLYLGRLMSPLAVTLATQANDTVPQSAKQSWCLCGDISIRMWETVKEANRTEENRILIGQRISLFTTPDQTAYGVFTLQADHMQARFLFPLGDKHVQQFIRDTVKLKHFWISLGKNETEVALFRPVLVTTASMNVLKPSFKSLKKSQNADISIESTQRFPPLSQTTYRILLGELPFYSQNPHLSSAFSHCARKR